MWVMEKILGVESPPSMPGEGAGEGASLGLEGKEKLCEARFQGILTALNPRLSATLFFEKTSLDSQGRLLGTLGITASLPPSLPPARPQKLFSCLVTTTGGHTSLSRIKEAQVVAVLEKVKKAQGRAQALQDRFDLGALVGCANPSSNG
jgi:hypothetical protein